MLQEPTEEEKQGFPTPEESFQIEKQVQRVDNDRLFERDFYKLIVENKGIEWRLLKNRIDETMPSLDSANNLIVRHILCHNDISTN